MVFETDRLILRPWCLEDAEELYKYAKDPRVGPRAGWPAHTSVENSREIIETVFSAEGTFAVVLKETGLPVGCIGYMQNANLPTRNDEVELGYWIGKPYWGQGLIPEACEKLIEYCFNSLGCSKIWCAYYAGNRNSCRVLQKCGFEYHHQEKDKVCELLNEYRTEHITVLTREHWLELKQKQEKHTVLDEEHWNVSFEGGFWGDSGWGSTPVRIQNSFSYCNENCIIPYIYLCPEGIVIDCCVGIEPEIINAFIQKWKLHEKTDYDDFSKEEQEAIDEEHPLMFHFDIDEIKVNGDSLKRTHGCGTSYIPESCIVSNSHSRNSELLQYLKRYELDARKAWKIQRSSYSWNYIKYETIESFDLHLKSDKRSYQGIHIENPKAGDRISFYHPVTGCAHTLEVLTCEKQLLDGKHFQDEELEYPKHFYTMQYQIVPEIPMENVRISDCAEGDSPRYKGNNGKSCGAVSVTAISGFQKDKGCRTIYSSIHFEPVEHIEWRMTFLEKLAEDAEIKLI